MTFKLTQLMAAAAITTFLSGQAMAAPITAGVGDIAYLNGIPLLLDTDSKAVLTYNSGDGFDSADINTIAGAVGALNLGRLQTQGINGVAIEETYVEDPWGEPGDMVRTGITASLRVQDHTLDDATGQLLSVSTVGGIQHSGTRISGTLTGGVATASNLRFDLVNKRVYADLTGTKAPVGSTVPAVSYDLPNTELWIIESVSGPTVIDPAALALTGQARIDALVASGFTFEGGDSFSARIELSNLFITTAGFDFLRNSLGLQTTGRGGFGAVNADPYGWGSTALNLSFSVPAVPEPGSYAMAGMGLLVVLGALRARRARMA